MMIGFIIFCCWIISFFFNGIESGLLSIDPVRLRQNVKRRAPAAVRLNRLLKHPERLLVSVLLVTNAADILGLLLFLSNLTFEEVVAKDGNADAAGAAREQAEAELATLQERISPLQTEINQLGRQFWVSKDQVKANNYDLSASRYRQVEQDEAFYEKPEVTLTRLQELEQAASNERHDIRSLLDAAI